MIRLNQEKVEKDICKGGMKMKGRVLMLVMIWIFGLGFAAANAHAEELISKTFKSSEINGLLWSDVEDPQGLYLGRVTDFVVDSIGRIEFAIVQVGFPEGGRDSKLVAVPFSALSRPEGKYYVLDTTRERLAAAPNFDEKKDLSDRAFGENVYRYFGLQPSWTDGGREKRIRSDQNPFDLVG